MGECLLSRAFKFSGLKYLIHYALPKFSKSYFEASLNNYIYILEMQLIFIAKMILKKLLLVKIFLNQLKI